MTNPSHNIPTLPGLELPEAALSFLEKGGPGMGEYSGEILRRREPRLYQAAVELLAREFPVKDVAMILQMNVRSVMAVRDNEPAAIAATKQTVARRYLDVSKLAAEVARARLLDDPHSISFKDLMIGGAVATDKHLVLSGEATQRIEHVVRAGDDDFDRMLKDARARGQLIEGEVIEVPADTDMREETSTQMAPPAAADSDLAPMPADPDVGEGSHDAVPDVQSGGIANIPFIIGTGGDVDTGRDADTDGCGGAPAGPRDHA